MSSSRQPTHRLTFMAFCCRERQGGLAQAGPALSLEGDRCHVGAGVGVGNTLKAEGCPRRASGLLPVAGAAKEARGSIQRKKQCHVPSAAQRVCTTTCCIVTELCVYM